MEILQLIYFYTVARVLNISRAANIHGIPQPAMSRTISRLEAELGTALFTREKTILRSPMTESSFTMRFGNRWIIWITGPRPFPPILRTSAVICAFSPPFTACR